MRKRSFVERNNDALLFWEYLGPAIYYIIGIIFVAVVLTVGFSIKGAIDRHNESVAAAHEQILTEERQEVVNAFIDKNNGIFGTVDKQDNNGNLFFVYSDKGEFTIAFSGTEVKTIFTENKAGEVVTLYENNK
jgi:uncharacterized membrane protein